jgi:UPF0042 nucleotide-binding protein
VPRRAGEGRAAGRQGPRLLVISGLSGSGKTHALRALEDAGWFCVDNMPTALIPRFGALILASEDLQHSALVVDMRGREFVTRFPAVLRRLRSQGLDAQLLFVESEERALVRRFSETRRPHPLAVNQPALEGIREEREALQPIRKIADAILDTSDWTVHELRDYIRERYDLRSRPRPLVVTVMSFGFRSGVPPEADLVFDVRFLPNPNFVPALKRLTGDDAPVVRFLRRQRETAGFLKRLVEFLDWLLPRYIQEGKSYLTIAVGCTGGRHRSVMIANALAKGLKGREVAVRSRHRDVKLP